MQVERRHRAPSGKGLAALLSALLLTVRAGVALAGTLGAPCASAAECETGHCVDGVCCESACDGGCLGCSPAIGSTGNAGECRPIAAGIDPKDGCDADPPTTCHLLGVCDGQGQCALHPNGTPCGLSGACADGVCVSDPLCDGDRTILGAGGPIEDCTPFRCSTAHNLCLKACSTNQDCVPGLACSTEGRCEAPITSDPDAGGCGLRPGPPPAGAASLIALVACWWLVAARRGGSRRSRSR